ncbi:TRAP transporter small permease subunit [Paracoccus saliphilus]|uniref:TRAP transporter small permease protein n=1 Tax=Paracoccus saliphilus TaxID=405559 RepID=A0AA45W6V3_9RHOB|nr:TRAP transporter small permease [Paracoccus saliphilus]WCR03791.1 TRAP transporter small permease [Paracoccus saliphilus]SIT04701.1 TRAP-type C4-dicarboxylate transport system, small permease component [Paracoccus saliphilus]
MIVKLHDALVRANRLIALILGIILVLTVLFIITDVVMRKSGWESLGGSDEISGYVMAAVASWGLACGLVERAHVRIDVIRQKLPRPGQALMDIFAMIVTSGIVLLIAWYCWPVLQKTIERGSRANTALETPLWIPQGIWFGGWLWFALSATALTVIGLVYFLRGQRDAFDASMGVGSELDK